VSLGQCLEGKRILVTGASSGVGASLAEQISAGGGKLLLTARREDRLRELVHRVAAKALVVGGDITLPETRARLKVVIEGHWGALDILINNAGVGAFGAFQAASPERLRRIFDVNFFAAAELTRELLPSLRKGIAPAIVNVGSVLGHRAAPLKSEYSAAKFALHGWSDALRCELAPLGIAVILISPSTIATDFFEHLVESPTPTARRPAAMSPAYVARRILHGIARRKREVLFPLSGRMLVYLDRLLPGCADRLLIRFGGKDESRV
jgi:short-subunit dehydrogenase